MSVEQQWVLARTPCLSRLCWCQLGGQEAGETPEQGCGALGTAGLVTVSQVVTVSQGSLLFRFLS